MQSYHSNIVQKDPRISPRVQLIINPKISIHPFITMPKHTFEQSLSLTLNINTVIVNLNYTQKKSNLLVNPKNTNKKLFKGVHHIHTLTLTIFHNNWNSFAQALKSSLSISQKSDKGKP